MILVFSPNSLSHQPGGSQNLLTNTQLPAAIVPLSHSLPISAVLGPELGSILASVEAHGLKRARNSGGLNRGFERFWSVLCSLQRSPEVRSFVIPIDYSL